MDTSKMDGAAIAGSLSNLQADDPFSSFRSAEAPCLLVYGLDDPSVRVPSTDVSLDFGPSVHQVNLADSGHFPMMDAADRFNRLLIDFLALEAGMSPRELQLREEWRRRVR